MARVSIYVSDELKARMDKARDALNWSDIARPAFEMALATYLNRKGQSMESAVQRLRASKESYLQHSATHGKDAGRSWGANKASFFELREISKIDLDQYEDDDADLALAIATAYDPDRIHQYRDLPEMIFGDLTWPPREWLLAWVKGAKEFFEEIEDQI